MCVDLLICWLQVDVTQKVRGLVDGFANSCDEVLCYILHVTVRY